MTPKATSMTVTVKPVITISVDTMKVLTSAIEKMKLWADPGQIKYIRKFKSAKDLFKISVEKDG
jgi:hypothetical protein